MNKPHIHAELIKAWADGAEIQYRHGNTGWVSPPSCEAPKWYTDFEYRIKPPKKTPGQVFFEQINPAARGYWENLSDKNYYEKGAKAVIEAYKQGMFDENCNC